MRTWLEWLVTHGLIRAMGVLGVWVGDLQAKLIVDPPLDPAPLFDELRADPLIKGRLSYLTVDHAVTHELLRSSDFRVLMVPGGRKHTLHPLRPPSLLSVEGDQHTCYRKAVSNVLTPRAVAALRKRFELAANNLLNLHGTVDIVEQYCSQLPVAIIGDILGVQDRAILGESISPSLDVGLTWRQYRRIEKTMRAFGPWLNAQLDRAPTDCLMSQLTRAGEDFSEGLTQAEMRGGIAALSLAGFESVGNLVSAGIRLLLDHPDQLEILRRNPELWPNAVDEIMRLEPPVRFTARIALNPVEIAGVRIEQGSLVEVYLAAANRDPKVFPDPHRFSVERSNAFRHLAFSGGRHGCPGNSLARMAGEVGLRAFFDRFPGAGLAGAGVRKDSRMLRGWAELPVVLG